MKFMRKNGGFTLVELIVVIAILAILAGVAVPAYSGYIKKANEAADNQLLGAVNTAFAAACIENNIDLNSVTNANISVVDGKVGTVTKVVGPAGVNVAKVAASFESYYAGNTGSAFKVFTRLRFSPKLHCFVNNDGDAYDYAGGQIFLNKDDINTLVNSGWMNYAGLGSEALLGKIDYVSNLGAGMLNDGGALSDVVYGDPAFMENLAATLGYDLNTQADEFGATFDSMVAQKAEMLKNDPQYAGMSDSERNQAAANQLMANSAVLSAAQNATAMNKNDITALLGSGNATNTIKGNLESDPQNALAQAALAYGMYTAYAHSTGDQTLINKANDPAAILNGLDDPDFQAYINSDQGKADLDGYLAGLNMINDSAQDSNAASDVLVNGFASEDLLGLLQQATGGK